MLPIFTQRPNAISSTKPTDLSLTSFHKMDKVATEIACYQCKTSPMFKSVFCLPVVVGVVVSVVVVVDVVSVAARKCVRS